MATLIFFGTILSIVVLVIMLLINLIRHKSIKSILRTIVIIVISYCLLWGIFYIININNKVIPLGTDVRFDDWCATVTKIEHPETIGGENPSGQFIVLDITMTNRARGIAQKPSDPRVHIIDSNGDYWAYSEKGQQALEKVSGKQIPLDQRLELNQALDTQLVFDVPKDAKDLQALIEEGPFITKLLLNDQKEVFSIQ
jgi:Telomeric repeat-binding factor 2.